jgi:hypothetical protein
MYRINYKKPLVEGALGYHIDDLTFANYFPYDKSLRILCFNRNDAIDKYEKLYNAFSEITICDTDGNIIMTVDDIDRNRIIIENNYRIGPYSNIEYVIIITQEDVDKGLIKYKNARRITQRAKKI